MSDKVTIEIKGLEECNAKLHDLTDRIANRKINDALVSAAQYLVDRIEDNTYVGKDNPAVRLNRSFVASGVRMRYPNAEVDIGPVKSKTAVAMAQELGFPNTPAHPAMVRTLDEEKQAIVDLFADYLNVDLDAVNNVGFGIKNPVPKRGKKA